jgi:hypothetical protein
MTFHRAPPIPYNTLIHIKEHLPMKWQPIETAPTYKKPSKMFAVIAKDVVVTSNGAPYTTDAYYVWREINGEFARWPHPFPPTHWHPMPSFD